MIEPMLLCQPKIYCCVFEDNNGVLELGKCRNSDLELNIAILSTGTSWIMSSSTTWNPSSRYQG